MNEIDFQTSWKLILAGTGADYKGCEPKELLKNAACCQLFYEIINSKETDRLYWKSLTISIFGVDESMQGIWKNIFFECKNLIDVARRYDELPLQKSRKTVQNLEMLFKPEVKDNSSEALIRLAKYYQRGNIVPTNCKKAFEYYKIAAELGSIEAQFQIAEYHHRYLESKDDEKAFYYYKLSADQGHAIAQYQVGFCYGTGTGTKRNLQEAFKYYELSADQGEDVAQLKISEFYSLGNGGVTKDQEKADRYNQLGFENNAKRFKECDAMRNKEIEFLEKNDALLKKIIRHFLAELYQELAKDWKLFVCIMPQFEEAVKLCEKAVNQCKNFDSKTSLKTVNEILNDINHELDFYKQKIKTMLSQEAHAQNKK